MQASGRQYGPPARLPRTQPEQQEHFLDAAQEEQEVVEDFNGPHPSIVPASRLLSAFGPYSNKSSKLWRYFHIFTKDDPTNVAAGVAGHACCNCCGRCIKVKGGSTSSLKQHLRSHHKQQFARLNIVAAQEEPSGEADEAFVDGIDYTQKHASIQPPERLESPFGPNSTKTSVFWKFFHVFSKDSPENIADGSVGSACCNICGKLVKICGGSTSALKVHLEIHHKGHYKSLNYQPKPTPPRGASTAVKQSSGPRGSRGAYHKSLKPEKQRAMDTIYRSIALWAIESDQDIGVIEDEAFRNVLKQVRSSAKIVTDADLSSNGTTMKGYYVKQQMQNVAYKLTGRMNLALAGKTIIGATDHWMSRDGKNFATFSAHFVDNFKLRHLTLEVVLYGNTGSELTATATGACKHIRTLGIDTGKQIPYTATDTPPNGNKFGHLINDMQTQHLCCIDCEIGEIAKIVFNFFGDSQNGDDTEILRKARALARLIEESPNISTSFKEARVPSQMARTQDYGLDVVKDEVKHWWSTYNMVSRLVKFRQEINVLISNGTVPVTKALSHKDWLVLDDLTLLLKPFANAIKPLLGSKFVTASMVPHVLPKIRTDLENMAHSGEGMRLSREVIACSTEMLQAFDHRYGNLERPFHDGAVSSSRPAVGLHKAFYFALLLDPRFKSLAGIKISDDHREKIWEALEDEMRKNETAFRVAKAAAAKGVTAEESSGSILVKKPPAKRMRADSVDEDDYFMQQFGAAADDDEAEGNEEPQEPAETTVASIFEESIDAHDIKSACQREIAEYREEQGLRYADRESGAMLDPLEDWWKDRYVSCPILWRLAQTYLAIPGTTCAMTDEATFHNAALSLNSQKLPNDIAEDCMLVKLNRNKMEGVDLMSI